MPLQVVFKPKKAGITVQSNAVENLINGISNIASITYHNFDVSVTSDNQSNEIKEVKFTFNGFAVLDKESSNMMHAVIKERLDELDIPFYLAARNMQRIAEPYEAAFLHQRFKPIKSRNAKDIVHAKNIEVPANFCCHLSGDIMDHPVYDIRSPETIYDFEFLMYWINKSEPKLMPHTKLLFNKFFLKTHYALKNEITTYVATIVEAADLQAREAVLKKYGAETKSGKAGANQALLKLSRSANASDEWHNDFDVLLKAGADINCQDDDPASRATPLHHVIKSGEHDCIIDLLYCGATIHIRDAYYRTAFDMMFRLPKDKISEDFTFVCELLKLISISPQREITLVHKIKETAADNPQRLAELLRTKYNQPVVSMPAIGKALRNACAQNNHQDLPLLLSSGICIDAVAEDSLNKRTALHWAVIKEAEECARFLLAAGARTDIRDNDKTPKEYASESSHPGIRALFGVGKENVLVMRPS